MNRPSRALLLSGVMLAAIGSQACAPATSSEATQPEDARCRHAFACAEVDGKVYLFGGLTPEHHEPRPMVAVFDIDTTNWSEAGEDPLPRVMHAGAALNGLIYVAGGLLDDGSTTGRVLQFDTSTLTWAEVAPLSVACNRHAMAVLDGKVYVSGGMIEEPETGGVRNTASVERYDPARNAWESVAPLPSARHALALVAYENHLYAIGGYGDAEGIGVLVESYDPETDTWRGERPLQAPRAFFGAAVARGAIWCIAGRLDREGTIEVFDPDGGSRLMEPRLGSRNRFGVAADEDKIVWFGGESDTETGLPKYPCLGYRFADDLYIAKGWDD